MLGLYEASRRGEFARVDSTMSVLIKRHPVTMRHVLADAISDQG
jgi:hypothetical protein